MEKKQLSFWELVIMGTGQIIGAGIMVLLCIAIGMTGKGVALAFLISAIIVVIPLIAIAALGSAIPNSGGMYTYVRDLIGKKTGFFYVALLVAGQLIIAQYAMGFADYTNQLWALNSQVVAGVVMTAIFVINLAGLKTSVSVQRAVVIVLVLSLMAFIGFGVAQVKDFGSFFQGKNIMPNGLGTFLAASILVRYALIGAEFLSEFGGEAKNPGKDIPRAMISVTLIIAFVYFLIAIVAAGVLPLDEVAFKNLGVVAKKILPGWMYYVFVIGGGMFGLFSSLNAVFAWVTKGLKQAIKDGWLPTWLAKENERFGTPHYLLIMFYIIGMFPIVLGQEIQVVSVIGANIGLIFSIFPVLALMFLAKKRPDAYENAAFKLPKWAMIAIPLISVVIYIIGIASSWDFLMSQGAIIPIVVFCALVVVYTFARAPYLEKAKAKYADKISENKPEEK